MADPKQPAAAVTRRDVILGAVGGAAVLSSVVSVAMADQRQREKRAGVRMPAVYLPHGGGPWPFVDLGFGDKTELHALAAYLRSLSNVTPTKPTALLVVSAHWEESVPTVMTSPRPPMLYDYYGFPPASYTITWPAPGHPTLAAKVRSLLEAGGFKTGADPQRGYDHGTFVPLKLAYPDAEIPVVQLSLVRGLDPKTHVAMGKALASLRNDGVFIVGSGMSYHNLGAFSPSAAPVAAAFDAWLRTVTVLDEKARNKALIAWEDAPAARAAHPREEHLLPLMVIAGAAGTDRGTIPYNGTILTLRLSACQFG